MAQFFLEHPTIAREWANQNLIILEVPNQQSLIDLIQKLDGYSTSIFREPDINNEITAIAVEGMARPILSNLKLLFTNETVYKKTSTRTKMFES